MNIIAINMIKKIKARKKQALIIEQLEEMSIEQIFNALFLTICKLNGLQVDCPCHLLSDVPQHPMADDRLDKAEIFNLSQPEIKQDIKVLYATALDKEFLFMVDRNGWLHKSRAEPTEKQVYGIDPCEPNSYLQAIDRLHDKCKHEGKRIPLALRGQIGDANGIEQYQTIGDSEY